MVQVDDELVDGLRVLGPQKRILREPMLQF